MAAVIAATLIRPRTFELQESTTPVPGPGQALIRVEGCGVCASSLPLYEGRDWFDYPCPPGAPGHEGWGRVEAVGPGVEVAPGTRAAFLGGRSFAELDVADAEALVALPPELDGRPFPGEAIGCAMNAFRRASVRAGQSVAVVGVGFLGGLLTALAAGAGATVVALSRRDTSLDLARRVGASSALPLADRGEAVAAARRALGEDAFDRVFECTGLQGPLDVASDLVGVRSTLIIAGYHQDGRRQVDLQGWNWRGIDVVNAHERDPGEVRRGIEEGVEAVVSGRLDLAPLLTDRLPLAAVGDALEAARRRPEGFVKAWVEA